MKSLILLTLFFRGFLSSTVAQSITLSSSTNTVDINTTFGLAVQVDGLTNPGEVQIQGVDKFVVRGQAQSTSMQLINGQQSLQVQLQLQLQPSSSGSFVLGPARIALGTGTIESNTITIDVTGEKLFLQPQQANTLLGVQENETLDGAEQEQQLENSREESNGSRRGWLVVLLIGSGFIWWKRKKSTNSSVIARTPISPERKSHPLPTEEDVYFREHMDLWWRESLSKVIHKECSSATYQELISHIKLVSRSDQQLFSEAFACIQQARYAQHEGDRGALLQLAKRFISGEHR